MTDPLPRLDASGAAVPREWLGLQPEGRTGPDRPVCLCVADHRPAYTEPEWHHIWPLGMGGPDTPRGRLGENGVWLCSNAHTNVHEVLRMILRRGGDLRWGDADALWPGLNRYAFGLAHEGYRRFIVGHGAIEGAQPAVQQAVDLLAAESALDRVRALTERHDDRSGVAGMVRLSDLLDALGDR